MNNACSHDNVFESCAGCEIERLDSALAVEREKVAKLEAYQLVLIQGGLDRDVELRQLRPKLEAAESQAARLREAIERAPHARPCAIQYDGYPCNCWKKEALQGEPK